MASRAAARFRELTLAQELRGSDCRRDVAAGCANFFIDYSHREKRPEPSYIAVKSLAEASSRILAEFP